MGLAWIHWETHANFTGPVCVAQRRTHIFTKREVKIEFYDTWMVSEGGVRLSSIDGPGMKRRRIDLTGN